MDENIKALLTWDNILLAMSLIGFSGGVGFVLLTSFRENPRDPDSSGPDSEEPKQKIKLEDLSQNWINPKKQKKEQILLADLYYRWRTIDSKIIPDNDDAVVHSFKNDRVRKFFHKYIHQKSYFKNARKQRGVIIQILHLLDDEADCPSVVDANSTSEPESALGATTYGILKRVSLLNHSLNVAEIVCQNIKKSSPQGAMLMAPDALVCALGHDLGKLPRFQADRLVHGQHPLTSNTILQDVKDFKLLRNREEIEDAVKRHHYPNLEKDKNPLLRVLGASDSKARVVELDVVVGLDKERFENQRYVYTEKEGDQAANSKPVLNTTSKKTPLPPPEEAPEEMVQELQIFGARIDEPESWPAPDIVEEQIVEEQEEIFYDDTPAPQPRADQAEVKKTGPARPQKKTTKPPAAEEPASPLAIAKAKADTAAAWEEQNFLYGISDPAPAILTEQAKTVTLDGWFSPGQFLTDLEKIINTVDGMQVSAFSMPHGKIYVAPAAMSRLIQKQAQDAKISWVTELDTYIDLADPKNQPLSGVWPTILNGIVDLFRGQGFIDPCIRPGFYGNHFIVVTEPIVTPGTRYYTVFLAEAFNATVPQLEKKKKNIARLRNIKDVVLAKKGQAQ